VIADCGGAPSATLLLPPPQADNPRPRISAKREKRRYLSFITAPLNNLDRNLEVHLGVTTELQPPQVN
jgi:hypothetical protein